VVPPRGEQSKNRTGAADAATSGYGTMSTATGVPSLDASECTRRSISQSSTPDGGRSVGENFRALSWPPHHRYTQPHLRGRDVQLFVEEVASIGS